MEDWSEKLTKWLRRHPLTVLLLMATACVNAIALLIGPDHDPIAGTVIITLFIAQLSLLAWWVTATTKFAWLRLLMLGVAAACVTISFADPEAGLLPGQLFALLFVNSIVVLIGSWIVWRLWGNNHSSQVQSRQFSLRQLLGATTLCAILAAVSRYGNFSDFIQAEYRFLVAVGDIYLVGVVGPGLVLLSGWPLYVRWVRPILFGLAIGFIMSIVVSDSHRDFWIFNILSTAIFSLWGLCIAFDAQRLDACYPSPTSCDSPPLDQDDHSPEK